MKVVHRYEVRADGQPHRLILGGPVLYVLARFTGSVEFWAIHDDGGIQQQRAFLVVGDGDEVPDGATHVGSAIAGGWILRHLFELPGGAR